MASHVVSVGLIQETASPDLSANLTRTVERIKAAAERGAQIISLQELFNAPYFCKSLRIENFDIAEPVNGPTVTTLQQLAQQLGVVLIVPFYEKQAAGLYRNSASVIDADGALLGTYRKMHIPHDPLFEEKYYFAPGDVAADTRTDTHPGINGFRMWRTKFANIGVLICWDQWYPEGARITSLLGADILFYPTA
ncbi:MAG: nitrilase-related carbon-nitrogen hydrolase, partial [Gemmatimonadaceae bacterium]